MLGTLVTFSRVHSEPNPPYNSEISTCQTSMTLDVWLSIAQ